MACCHRDSDFAPDFSDFPRRYVYRVRSHTHANQRFSIVPDQKEFSLRSVKVSLTPLERFREFLDSRGKRLTQQRQMILERILERHDHFEADELVEMISYAESTKRVSRPTVYRTLNELSAAGVLPQTDAQRSHRLRT